jgi:hypothetical protein
VRGVAVLSCAPNMHDTEPPITTVNKNKSQVAVSCKVLSTLTQNPAATEDSLYRRTPPCRIRFHRQGQTESEDTVYLNTAKPH